jgi:hypothetical protein
LKPMTVPNDCAHVWLEFAKLRLAR